MSNVLQRLREATKTRLASMTTEETTAGAAAETERSVKLIPIASGKGGVGKTNIAVNIAVSAGLRLARHNRRVLLIDGDIGMPNTDLVLGVRPDKSVADLIDKSVDDISQLVSTTRYPALDFIAGAEEASLLLGNLYFQQRRKLMGEISRLTADLVVFDLGASASKEILDFFAMSSSGIIVLNPEPSSLRDGYVFLKNAALRRMRTLLDVDSRSRHEFDTVIEKHGRNWKRLREALTEAGPSLSGLWQELLDGYRPMIIVNRAESFTEGMETGRRFTQAVQSHLGLQIRYIGSVLRDDAVTRSVKAQKPFRIAEPGSQASRCVDEITQRLLDDRGVDLDRNFAAMGRVLTARLLGKPV